MPKKLVEKIVTEREVTGTIADLVQFAREMHCKANGIVDNDSMMINFARDYWDREHGED